MDKTIERQGIVRKELNKWVLVRQYNLADLFQNNSHINYVFIIKNHSKMLLIIEFDDDLFSN